jgi:hypothetical protein
MNDLESLIIPLDGVATDLKLPYVVCSAEAYEVTLKELTKMDIERAFRLKIIEDPETGVYHMEPTDQHGFYGDDHIMFFLHDAKLQVCVTPKGGLIDEKLRERVSMALECALGFFDEHVSWLYPTFATVASRGAYRSHRSARRLGVFGQNEVDTFQKILQYEQSEYLPDHKFDTLRALLNTARHQAGASDVACVLYFSILEAILVDDNKELSYKLSMRLAKYLGKDYEYAKKINKLYGKRGHVIHGSNKGNVFTGEEYLLVESLAKDFLVEIVADPSRFTEQALDSQLLA